MSGEAGAQEEGGGSAPQGGRVPLCGGVAGRSGTANGSPITKHCDEVHGRGR